MSGPGIFCACPSSRLTSQASPTGSHWPGVASRRCGGPGKGHSTARLRSRSTTGLWRLNAERRRFLSEARAAGNLSGHPGIVTVHDAGIMPDGHPYLVMKLCSGGSLTRWLRPDNRQSQERVCTVGIRIADALAVAHEQGMVHRDVKPANILIDSYGNPGLADFGLAAPEPGSGGAAGMTVAYAPPEVILGEPPAAAGDVYQLAATLYALLSGRPPSEFGGGPTSLADRVARLKHPTKPLPGVDEGLMRVLLAGLAFSPADRPTAAQFRDRLAALDLVARGGTGRTVRQLSGRAEAASACMRVALALVSATVVSLLVVMLGGSGVYLYEIDRSVTANINRELDLPPEETAGERRPVKAPEADQTLDYLLIGTDDGNPDAGSGGTQRLDHAAPSQPGPGRGVRDLVPAHHDGDHPGSRRRSGSTARTPSVGAPLVVRTLEKLTDTRVDHVAMIDFAGLRQPHRRTSTESPCRTGLPSAVKATPFRPETSPCRARRLWCIVRERHAFGQNGELQRAENQRNVLKAILAKGLSPEVICRSVPVHRLPGQRREANQGGQEPEQR